MSPVLEMPASAPPQKVSTGKKFFFSLFLMVALVLGAIIFLLFQNRIVSTQSVVTPVVIPITTPLTTALTDIFVQEGSHVKQGALLARLDIKEYARHLPHAQALVRGAMPSTAHRVQEAQQAEADMVNRIAIARHEEKAKHTLVEKLSVEHAKALLYMRSIQGNAQKKAAASQAEQSARNQLEQARAAHEFASRTRSSIETVLHNLRAQRRAQGQSMGTGTAMAVQEINNELTAPIEGYVMGSLPHVGQVLQKDSLVLNILPTADTQLKVSTHVPKEQTSKLSLQTTTYLVSGNTLLRGNVQQILHDSSVSIVSITFNASGQDYEALATTMQQGQAKIVFWPQSWIQQYIPVEVLALLSYL